VLDAIRGGLPGEAHRRPSRAGRELVDTVLGAVEENLAEPWTLASLARRAHVSPAYLNELFNAHLGAPPMQVLSRLRTERAAALLRSTDLPIGRIAAAVGWPDPNYFARRFKAWQGISPGAYRRHP
jgi:AraC family L-rhamnose operon transcriptional activator RhaR